MIIGEAELMDLAAALGLAGIGELAGRELGSPVKHSRSSWVRRCETPRGDYYVKTYEYQTWVDRLRGALRCTGPLVPSRARREAAALTWLRSHGFAAPRPVGVLEQRHLGFVRRALLVTEAWPGQPLDRLLPALLRADQERLATDLGTLVGRLHRAGFRSRNLDLRNVLATDTDGRFELALLDAPRFRLRRPGAGEDSLARADWRRLLPQLAALQLEHCALAGRAAATAP